MNRFSIVMAAALTLSACGGGGGGFRVRGIQCPEKFDPIPLTIGKNEQKLSLKTNDPDTQLIPDGTYKYDGASFYYVADSGFRIQVDDVKQKGDDTFKAKTYCVRNAVAKSRDMNISKEGVGQLDVDSRANSKISATYRSLGFRVDDEGRIIPQSSVPAGSTNDPSGKIYADAQEFFVVKRATGNSFEVRSMGRTADKTATYYLSIRLIKE